MADIPHRLIAWTLVALAITWSAAADAPRLLSLAVQGTDFRAAFSDGRVLHGIDLIGATLDYARPDGGTTPVRIAAAFPDPRDPTGEVWLFDMRVIAQDGTQAPLCEPDPDGKRLALPLAAPGQRGGFTLTCSGGAIGKCIRFGYRPWATAPDGVTSLARLHAICVRLIRADYGGTGHGWTRTGMPIDIWDSFGIQHPATTDPMPFEAGWSDQGAVCVAHPRVPENGLLPAIIAEQPRLAGHVGPEQCTEAIARELGAMLFNRSPARP